MKDVQTKFLATEENGQKCCQKYVDNMGKMKSSLIQTKFNNLASLQVSTCYRFTFIVMSQQERIKRHICDSELFFFCIV
jgi:hypothetical protein